MHKQPPIIGDRIIKDQGDYQFVGTIIGILTKRSGAIRYAIEDDRGLILIMNDKQFNIMEKVEGPVTRARS